MHRVRGRRRNRVEKHGWAIRWVRDRRRHLSAGESAGDRRRPSPGRGAMSMHRVILILSLLLVSGAQAQEFPAKPLRFVVPYAAGGSGDLLARLLGDKLSKLWGQQGVVAKKPG